MDVDMQEAPKAAVSSSSGLTVSSQMQTALDQGAGNPDPPSPSFTPPPEEKVSQVPRFAAASALGNSCGNKSHFSGYLCRGY